MKEIMGILSSVFSILNRQYNYIKLIDESVKNVYNLLRAQNDRMAKLETYVEELDAELQKCLDKLEGE